MILVTDLYNNVYHQDGNASLCENTVWEIESQLNGYILLRYKNSGRYLSNKNRIDKRPEFNFYNGPYLKNQKSSYLGTEFYSIKDDTILWEIFYDKQSVSLKNRATNSLFKFVKFEKFLKNTLTTTTTSSIHKEDDRLIKSKDQRKEGKKRNFKMVFNVKHKNKWFEILDTANEFDCLKRCQLIESCNGASATKINATTFRCVLFKKGFDSEYNLNWISFIKIVSESTIISTVEYTTFKETHVAKVLASSICYELSRSNNTLSSFIRQLDENLVDTNGWSIISFSKLTNIYSSSSLNTIQNLYLFGSCTSSLIDLEDDIDRQSITRNIDALKTASFILFYSPEKNCIYNNTEGINPTENQNPANVQNYQELDMITKFLALNSFGNEFLSFKKYKIHRSTNIASPFRLSYLINCIESVITDKKNNLFLAEEVKKKVGQYWNVLVNPIGLISQVSVVFNKDTFLRIEMLEYDIIMFQTPLNKCH